MGVMSSVTSAGLRVPDDLSIVACDAVGMSEFLTPPLATIRRDPSAMGSAAAELLLRQIRGGPAGQTILATAFEPTIGCGPPGSWLRHNAGRPPSSKKATRP
jgi:DNA-binding LacI/PurR family transcriptional regulator